MANDRRGQARGTRPNILLVEVARRPTVGTEPTRCATCDGTILPGEPHRRDEWPEPVFGDTIASAICVACEEDGL